MRSARSEHILLVIMLAIPLAIALLGWPPFLKWAAVGPPPRPTPEVAGAAATSSSLAAVARPTPKPTAGAPETLVPRAVATQPAPTQKPTATPVAQVAAQPTATPVAQVAAQPTAQAAAQPTAQIAAQPTAQIAAPPVADAGAADPTTAVQDFYARVAQHDFSAAAELWTPRMRARFPPQQNIDDRFAQTQNVTVRRADVIALNPASGQAQVAVDLVESTSLGQRHWSGSWQLVKGPNGWLLDQPALEAS